MTRDPEKTTPFVKDDPKPARGKTDQKSPRGGPAPGPYRDRPEKVATAIGPMFGNFDAAKKRKMPRWAAPLLSAVLIGHVVMFTTMYVKSIWDLEQLDKPKNSSDLAIAPTPPPPPPPPKGGAKPKDVTITPKKIKVKDIVQPVKIEKQQVEVAQVETGDPNGVEGGVEGGVVGGDLNGVVAAPPPPPPPPPPAPPPTVAPTAADANRIAGEKNIVPDDVTKTEIQRSGKDSVSASFKLCITIDGAIGSVSLLKSTGFGAYDSKIKNTISGEWRYRPFTVNGKATPVCTAVTFIYRQK